MVTPANFAPLAATWTAEGAVGAVERLREGFGNNPPWHDIRHDREALVRFTLEAMRVRGSRPNKESGACESLIGWTWAGLDIALRRVGTYLADVVGNRRLTYSGSTYSENARKIRVWIDKHRREPSRGSVDPIEQKLGVALGNLRRKAPECCVAEGLSPKADLSEARRHAHGKHQFAQFAEVVVMLACEWRAAATTKSIGVETGAGLNTLLQCAHNWPSASRGLAYVPDLCQVNSIAAGNAEIEADCWRFTLAGETSPDPRPWSEMLASGDHVRIERAERVAFLDWKDSRLRDGTRWTDPRTGTVAGKCPVSPAVRRPWTPPATPAAAPAPSDEDLTRRGACAS